MRCYIYNMNYESRQYFALPHPSTWYNDVMLKFNFTTVTFFRFAFLFLFHLRSFYYIICLKQMKWNAWNQWANNARETNQTNTKRKQISDEKRITWESNWNDLRKWLCRKARLNISIFIEINLFLLCFCFIFALKMNIRTLYVRMWIRSRTQINNI